MDQIPNHPNAPMRITGNVGNIAIDVPHWAYVIARNHLASMEKAVTKGAKVTDGITVELWDTRGSHDRDDWRLLASVDRSP